MGLVGDDLLSAIDQAESQGRSNDVMLFLELAKFRCKERWLEQAVFFCPEPKDFRRIEIDG